MEYILDNYLEKYLVFETDFLTNDLKDKIDINEDDCYMLCYGFINETGLFRFIVLAVGPTLEDCTKGLEIEEPLKQYSLKELLPYSYEEVDPDEKAEIKCNRYLDKHEPFWPELTRQLRKFPVFNGHRDMDHPDLIYAECMGIGNISEIMVKPESILLYGICEGNVIDHKDSTIVKDGETVKLFSGIFDGEPVVVAIKQSDLKNTLGEFDSKLPKDFDWDKMSESLKKELDEMFEDMEAQFFNKGNMKC